MHIPSNSGENPTSRKKRDIALWLALPVLTFIAACHTQVQSKIRPPQPEKSIPQQEKSTPSPRDVAPLCESIKDIEILPMKDEPVADPAYNALVSAGEDAIPCLIRKITDEAMMKDPRQAPTVRNLAVGDTAFFVLVRIAKLGQGGFRELLPPDVRKAYDGDEGIYGYFRYIDEDGNRKKLQDAAVKWYEKKYGRSLP